MTNYSCTVERCYAKPTNQEGGRLYGCLGRMDRQTSDGKEGHIFFSLTQI